MSKDGKWMRGDTYFTVSFMREDNVKECRWSDDHYDNCLNDKGLAFKTHQEASEQASLFLMVM